MSTKPIINTIPTTFYINENSYVNENTFTFYTYYKAQLASEDFKVLKIREWDNDQSQTKRLPKHKGLL